MTAALAAEPRAPYEPPPNTEHQGDWRWYVHPTTDERFVSVTTALDAVDKGKLLFWATGLSAQAAFVELPRIVTATIRPLCGNSRNNCEKAGRHDWRESCPECPCTECRDCVTLYLANRHFAESSRRADEGRRVHKHIEHWALHRSWREVEPELQPYITSFRRLADDYGLSPDSWELSEATVLNRERGWGGTLDAQVRIHSGRTELADDLCARLGHPGGDVLVTTDLKTREKPESRLFPDHSLQLSAYRRGEVVMFPDGREEPLPPTDGGVLLQLRPGDYTFRPLVTDDTTYGAFLNALGLFRWLVELGAKSTHVASFPLPEEYKRERTNRKARERRAAKKAAAPAARAEPTTAPAPRAEPAAGTDNNTAPAQPADAAASCRQCYQPLPANTRPGDPCEVCGKKTPRPRKKTTTTAKRSEPLNTGQRLGLQPRTPVAAQVSDPFDLIDDPPF